MKLRRGNKEEAAPAPGPVEGGPPVAEGEPAVTTVAVEDTPSPPPPQPAAWEPPAPGYADGGTSPPPGRGGLFGRMYGDVGEQSAEERDRQAAREFQQVVAPAMELLQASVPEASSPEEASRILEQSQGELVADPDGGAFIHGDAFENDARVYYRLLRRDYEKTPRPSEKNKRRTSPHLHQVYGRLTGNKGW